MSRSPHWLILPCVHAKSLQLRPTLCDPLDCSPQGSSIHGILQARILEWVAISSSRGSSQPRDQTWVSCITSRFFTLWVTREAPRQLYQVPYSQALRIRMTNLVGHYSSNYSPPPIPQWFISISHVKYSPSILRCPSLSHCTILSWYDFRMTMRHCWW